MRLVILLSLVILSCSDETVPKGVLASDKMEAVLYDVIRADEMVDVYSIQDSAYRNFSKRSALYDSVFHIHAISKEGFQKSLQFYQDRPDLLKTIFDSLQKRTDTTVTVRVMDTTATHTIDTITGRIKLKPKK